MLYMWRSLLLFAIARPTSLISVCPFPQITYLYNAVLFDLVRRFRLGITSKGPKKGKKAGAAVRRIDLFNRRTFDVPNSIAI